jgi:hypothetical protein
MPSPAAVKARTGRDKKKGKRIFGRAVGATTSFNAIMDAVQAHNDYIVSTPVASSPRMGLAQVAEIHRLIDRIVAASRTYLAKDDPDDEVASLASEMISSAALEKKVVIDIAAYWAKTAASVSDLGTPKWFIALPSDPRTYRFKATDTDAKKITAAGGGGGKGMNKEVKKVTNAQGDAGFFANDSDTGDYSAKEFTAPRDMLKAYGVTGDLKLGNRSIAMSRLDKLLNAGVIARTERGLLGDRLGTFQWEAKGKSMDDAIAAGDDIDDPNLTRLLSRLQLIDTIAGQIDRHEGNYFIQRDDSGKVIGITGIDLDMSWVTEGKSNRFDVEEGARGGKGGKYRTDPFPGFCRYVDKELAQRIIALDPDDLRVILMDLLEPAAVEAAVGRLLQLQALLNQLDTVLLEPHEWTKHIMAQIVKEKHAGEENQHGAKSQWGRAKAAEELKWGDSFLPPGM